MTQIRIGCSGWNYRHWRERFYPEKLPVKSWFGSYAQKFDTVEINNSFYRLPRAETFAIWREQAPSGFCYAVKANRFITQAKKLKECDEPLARMNAPLRHLIPALGPVLYQLPPSLGLNLERLECFLKLLPGDLTHAFEFRHASWYVEETAQLLDAHGAAFVVYDFPGLVSPRWVTGRLAYVRFHGASGKYAGSYGEAALREWADWMVAQDRPVWAYFNNDVDVAAPKDALRLSEMVVQATG